MKISPLHWRGAGVGGPEREEPTPKADAFSVLPERGFSREIP